MMEQAVCLWIFTYYSIYAILICMHILKKKHTVFGDYASFLIQAAMLKSS